MGSIQTTSLLRCNRCPLNFSSETIMTPSRGRRSECQFLYRFLLSYLIPAARQHQAHRRSYKQSQLCGKVSNGQRKFIRNLIYVLADIINEKEDFEHNDGTTSAGLDVLAWCTLHLFNNGLDIEVEDAENILSDGKVSLDLHNHIAHISLDPEREIGACLINLKWWLTIINDICLTSRICGSYERSTFETTVSRAKGCRKYSSF